MTYRGESPGVACHRHPAAPAPQSCAVCERPICDLCVSFQKAVPHCPECAAKVERARKRRRNLFICVAMILSGAVVGELIHLAKPYQRDHGAYEARIETLELALEADHCNEDKQLELIDLLGKSGDPNGMTHRWAIFIKHCPWLATKYGFKRP